MIDAALVYLAYCAVVAALVLVWFTVGTWLLDRRDLRRDAAAIADLIEHEAAERDHREPARHLRLVDDQCGQLIDARSRFAARRAVARYPHGGAA